MPVEAKYSTTGEESRVFYGNTDEYKLEETDRNAPREPTDSKLGDLRREIMTVQKQVNEFLTERMQQEQVDKSKEAELETKMLDGNDDVDE